MIRSGVIAMFIVGSSIIPGGIATRRGGGGEGDHVVVLDHPWRDSNMMISMPRSWSDCGSSIIPGGIATACLHRVLESGGASSIIPGGIAT